MNYCGIIAKVDKVEPIEGADRIQVAYVLGEPVVVSKEVEVGHVGVFFPPDTELSKDYLSNNNLYRHTDLNVNKDKAGFFDDNGRVRAQPFRKVKSCGYFTELESLVFTGADVYNLNLGDQFEELNGVQIAKKYVNPNTLRAMGNAQKKARKAVETPYFHQHVDTDQFKYNIDRIPVGSVISIQAKGHGTSARYSNTLVVKEPDYSGWKGKLRAVADFINGNYNVPVKVSEYVAGTRRVVLKSQDKDKEGFHGSEAFRFEILEELKPHLEAGTTIYGEIVGYANDKPIMGTHNVETLKDKAYTKKYGKEMVYKYGCPQGNYKFYAYRVTFTTPAGVEVDLTEPQLVEWCNQRGIEPPMDLVEPFVYDGNKEALMELVEDLTERPDVLTEDYRDPSHVNEGVVIRVDNGRLTPKFYKNKSKAFRIMEGIYKEDNVDMEDAS